MKLKQVSIVLHIAEGIIRKARDYVCNAEQENSECMHTHPCRQINQFASRATEIHIMWLLSYSTLIKPRPSQQRGETAVNAEGQEKEENYSLILCEQACVHILSDYSVCTI